jgi:N-acetylmuramoyl-L-alanine amidase
MSSHTFSHDPSAAAESTREHAVFKGLQPRHRQFDQACEPATTGIRKTLWGSLPFVMTGTLAAGVGVTPGTAALEHVSADDKGEATTRADHRPGLAQRLATAALPLAHAVLSTVRPDLPATYTVQSGDSVSSIASRFGVPTPAILTLNGLRWNSVVHEGQILKLSAEPTKKRAGSPVRLAGEGYIVEPGDSVSSVADRLGISTVALLAHNDLDPSSVIYAGQFLRVPGASVETIERQLPADMPVIAVAPTIIQASTTSEAGSATENEDQTPPVEFDAADLALADRPTLVTVKVPAKSTAPAPKPAAPAPPARATTPAPKPPSSPSQNSTPAATPSPTPAPATGVGQPVTGSITPLNDERRANARIIISVGRELGVPDYGIVIALATAMQESSLRNINWGDRDSLGLYQQRPSTGWGTAEQIMDPAYSTRLFFGGPQNPNKGRTRGLLDIAGWQNMALTDAAQRVQISAYPLAYAKWEPSAWAWLYELS